MQVAPIVGGTRGERLKWRSVAAVVALFIVGLWPAAAHASSSAWPDPAPRAPKTGALLGAFVGLPGTPGPAGVAKTESQLGRRLQVDSHYYNWADPFPTEHEENDARFGRTPMITWWGTSLPQIIDGSQDAIIRARAIAVAKFNYPVFIRWGAEMNGNWYAWSGSANDDNPQEFVLAWRHIHDIFSAEGATNVAWVWAPNADSHPGGITLTSWNSWNNYYPGNAYVDWVGIDGFNWGGNDWQSFGQIMGAVYKSFAGKKPIMIAETATVGSGADKARWIAQAGTWVKSHPAVKALVWFDTNESSSRINWRIDTSPSALRAFRSLALSAYFQAKPAT